MGLVSQLAGVRERGAADEKQKGANRLYQEEDEAEQGGARCGLHRIWDAFWTGDSQYLECPTHSLKALANPGETWAVLSHHNLQAPEGPHPSLRAPPLS